MRIRVVNFEAFAPMMLRLARKNGRKKSQKKNTTESKRIEVHVLKRCAICGCEIENGVNGCNWYDTCFKCKPIHYYQKPITVLPDNMEEADYWENQILERQERYYDD